MSNSLNFLIVDSQSVVRQGLRSVIKANYPFADIFNACSVEQATETISEKNISIVIFDININEGDSLQFIKDTLNVFPKTKFLIFTSLSESCYALRYIKAGVCGFLCKKSPLNEIKKALDEVLYNGKYFSKFIQDKIFDNYVSSSEVNPLEDLSEREMEITRLLVKGKGNLEISRILEIRQNTVSTIKKRIFKKIGIDNLVDLVSYYKMNAMTTAESA